MDRIHKIILSAACAFMMAGEAGPGLPEAAASPGLPYHPQWVSIVKKGKLFKYKRKEFSSPAIHGDLIFTGSDSGAFYAMTKKNGRKIWRVKVGAPINAAPGFAESSSGLLALIGDDKGILHALAVVDGREIWRQDLGSEILSAPAVLAGKVFAVTSEGRMAAMSVTDGRILWQIENPLPGFQMTIRGTSGVVADPSGGRLFAGFSDGSLWAVSPADGRVLWKKSLSEEAKGFHDIDGTPVVQGDKVYVATFDGGVYALSKSGGQSLWSFEAGSGVRLLARDQFLYVSGSDGTVYSLAAKDGKPVWKTFVGKGALTAPVAHQNLIIVGLSGSTVNFLDATDGHVKARRFARKGLFSDPLIDEGKIYYLSNGGRLYSLALQP